ncbi:CLUMA_CG008063, isoform A [Clunio marinus]|uniref:CLUMA_CG008063, isoform A n=1 Tax=Clunio marinus TaxID=568069 RepID=A0A1J1I478_9DIPT|nr:CLUMA_CG008063, isoform A [Clunio marinus]
MRFRVLNWNFRLSNSSHFQPEISQSNVRTLELPPGTPFHSQISLYLQSCFVDNLKHEFMLSAGLMLKQDFQLMITCPYK